MLSTDSRLTQRLCVRLTSYVCRVTAHYARDARSQGEKILLWDIMVAVLPHALHACIILCPPAEALSQACMYACMHEMSAIKRA